MLDFFRRYQRYFFLVITIVTIVSFSFFGTYSTMGGNTWRDQIAFKAINGQDVPRSDVDEMANFLATDNEDKLLYGGVWGPNFLNDGVIRKDFLETGLAEELVAVYAKDVQEDLQKRLEKEKKYKLYAHPEARFLSVENIWNYFIPEMSTYFQALRNSKEATGPDSFLARQKLFLAERRFPSPTLRQVLRYQEKQYNWLGHDPKLDQMDLSLFGYHTLEDWFGPNFTRLVSQFIINTAILAEQKGYSVSKAEVMADLVRQTELSYQQTKKNDSIGVTSPEQYFNEQLRRLNMDQSKAIKTWRQVMLFRRYFQDAGHSALTDVLTARSFNDFAHETVVADAYRLPSEFRFSDYGTLQNFEIYLQLVSKRNKAEPLALPSEFLTVEEVEENDPELVQKRYRLELTKLNKKELQSRIGLKETWNWEVKDENWKLLQKRFPELVLEKEETRQARYQTLEKLDSITRAKVDQFARTHLVDEHPEWIEKTLSERQPQQMEIGLRVQGGKMPIEGLESKEQRQAFIQLLDQAEIDELPTADSKLNLFTADGQTYYRIVVVEKANQSDILTFAEANEDGTLQKIKADLLNNYYSENRDKKPEVYQNENQEWKPFSLVQEIVSDDYFDPLLKSLQVVQQDRSGKEENQKPVNKNQLASLRFYPFFKTVKNQMEQAPDQASRWLNDQEEADQKTGLKGRLSLSRQWFPTKNPQTLERHTQQSIVDVQEAFALPTDGWSSIKTPVNGDLVFFQTRESIENSEAQAKIAERTKLAYQLLSWDAQCLLMKNVLEQIVSSNAISIAYMNQSVEEPSDSENAIETQPSDF